MKKHPAIRGGVSAYYALVILFAINLLNYIDRQVLYAVFPLIKEEFRLSDTSLGLLGSAFMICYMVSAPIFAFLGFRTSRCRMAATGVFLWSLSTVFSGLAPTYLLLLIARTLVGVGEASFSTVSPGLLAGYFTEERRGRILSYFYLAIPVGSALGYLLGGIAGQKLGWHAAFLLVSGPGLILTVPLWRLADPDHAERSIRKDASIRPSYGTLFRNKTFIINTLAMAAMTFSLGGLAQWIPSFLHRAHHLDIAKANTIVGAVTVLAGITGTLFGGWIGDRWQKRSVRGHLLVSGWGFLIGAPIIVWVLYSASLENVILAMYGAEFFLFLSTGPLNAVIVNITVPAARTMAFALNIFFIHALGDAVSPTAIGWLSDLYGLRSALLTCVAAILVAACLCFLCACFIGRDIKTADMNTMTE